MPTKSAFDDTCGLRERKKRETRRALHHAALDLVDALGYAAVTTEAIAERAGVSARTFFNYFSSKESAVLGVTGDQLAETTAAIEARPEGESPLASLRLVLGELLAPASADRDLRAKRRRILLAEPALAPALVGNNILFENAVTAALERRLGVRPGSSVEARVTVAAAIGAVRACIEHQQNGGSGRLERNIELAFEQLAAGLP